MSPIFELKARDEGARAGVLRTAHGDVPTPAFMPVATQGSVKALDPVDLRAAGAAMILANTYHLYLRPGVETVAGLGGLHGFMSWPGPVLTDSGGFQGFSLEHMRELDEAGIVFKSHLDGSLHRFTPETVVDHQRALGADVIMPLDVCVASDRDRDEVEAAADRTGRWAARSLEAHGGGPQALFGIVQGGVFEDLRARSAAEITSMGLPRLRHRRAERRRVEGGDVRGGGVHRGAAAPDRPRYLMGVGAPEDLVECVARGVDMFDCVLPTRIARGGSLYVREGRINVDTAPFRDRDGPIDPGCDCHTCGAHSTAYLNHLFRARELLAYRLATIHNVRFVLRLMEEMRAAVLAGRFEAYRRDFHARFTPSRPGNGGERKRGPRG